LFFSNQLLAYVEGKMAFIAPNLVALLGSNISTKLMGLAGGIHALAKIPACNILVMGKSQKTLSGFSISNVGMHMGYIYQSNLITQTPPEYRSKAARLLAAKCALASRIDSVRDAVDGSIGSRFRTEIEEKLEKLQEAPPSRLIKALPVPVEQPKKRRGGKR
jgi:U4/U6 small nuclear ribonucleoprotein PRP31